MMLKGLALLACLAICLPSVAVASGWAYEDAGEWGTDYPACGTEGRTDYNSPIDLTPRVVTGNLDHAIRLNDAYFFPQRNVYVSNNAYTLQLDLPRSKGYSLQFNHGETLGTIPYYLQQIHFHWGQNDDEGTEHTFNGDMYALEMHFVHYNGNFDNIGAAAGHPRGLSVLGLLYKIGAHNPAFDPILNSITDSKVLYGFSNATIDSLVLADFFPSKEDFYNYQGSLTTPPCYESVNWIVYSEVQEVSAQQMAKFRALVSNKKSEPSDPLAPNYRPVQPVNGRPVRLYSPGNSGSGSQNPTTTTTRAPSSQPSGSGSGNGNFQGASGFEVVEVEDSETKGIAIAILVLVAVLLLVLAVIFVTTRIQSRNDDYSQRYRGKDEIPMHNGGSNSHV